MVLGARQIAADLREIYQRDGERGREAIEAHLDTLLVDRPESEKQLVLQAIAEQFEPAPDGSDFLSSKSGNELLKFISLLLGKSVNVGDVSEHQVQQRLSDSLQRVFSGLNQVLRAIDSTLSHDDGFDATIRSLLVEELECPAATQPLETYIDRIRASFLTSYESSKTAHRQVVEKMLEQLAPETILAQTGGGFKFGALRKAEAFDRYVSVYQEIRSWHESGRGLEDYLRAFEKNCSAMPQRHNDGGGS